jgi:hypothetical protein
LAEQIINKEVPVIKTWYGATEVSCIFILKIDPENCVLEIEDFILNGTDRCYFGTGVNWNIKVNWVSPVVSPCESPPDTCKKTITITFTIVEQYYAAGGQIWSSGPFTLTGSFTTSCLEQCCE